MSSAGGSATCFAMGRPDITYIIRRANQDIAKPKVRTEARLKRVARYLLGEPELIWTCPCQEMPTKLVVRANWTGGDSEDQRCFSCVVVRLGEHVIDVVCSKHDVVSLSAPESEFYSIHTKNIFSDLQIDVSVRLETDSTSAYGICRHRGVGRLRHSHKKELWLQDQVAAKNIEMRRVSSEDNEADLGTKCTEQDRITKCVTNFVCRGLGLGWRTVACGFRH